MADPDRTPPHSLIDWGELAATLHRAGPFAVLRRLEAQARDLPRIRTSSIWGRSPPWGSPRAP